MLGSIRSVFQSKIGVALALGFLALIGLAFASADISGSSTFGGVAGGDRVAEVGDQRIGTATFSQAASNAFERARQDNPALTMQRFVASGALGQILDDLISRNAVFEFAKDHGITASDRLVDSEIVKIPAFQGPDGRFSQQAYNQLLAQERLSDQQVREDLAQGLVLKQVLLPAQLGARMPQDLAVRYAALGRERRKGSVLFLPSAAFAPKAPPSDEALQRHYAANRQAYTRPERRTIRYASFGEEALRAVPAPSEAEVAKAYNENRSAYAGSQTRTIRQVVLPTQAAAQALIAEVGRGASLQAAAQAKGLLPSTATLTREALASQTSAAVAEAVFAAGQGEVAGPARSGLGWHVALVERITTTAGRSLAQARPEIVASLTAERRRAVLSDLSARIEEQLDEGANLSDVAREMGLSVATSAPLLANGQVFGQPGATAPADLARVLPTAFQMDRENEAQLAEVVPGERFVMFELAEIVAASPPPLAEVRDRVARDWALAQGSERAKAAADSMAAALARGQSPADAARAAGAALPPAQTIDASRQELVAGGRPVPPPLALMFSMAEGTAKRIAAPARQGWFVVKLEKIVPATVERQDPAVVADRRRLSLIAGGEYAEQLGRAMRQEVKVRRNQAAVEAVGRQLTGGQ